MGFNHLHRQLTEVVTKIVERDRQRPHLAWQMIQPLGLEVMDFDLQLARRAGELHALTSKRGLSLTDRACLALAERERLPVLTTDKVWAKLDIGIDIRVVR